LKSLRRFNSALRLLSSLTLMFCSGYLNYRMDKT
jgi:hypothetical protein